MESKIKKVTIADGGAKKEFSIRLFGALEGIDFLDEFLGDMAQFVKGGAGTKSISIKRVMGRLLPLASILGGDGKPLDTLSIEKIDNYFENPLAAVELAMDILEHQMVFMNESEQVRQYLNVAKAMFAIPTSDSATTSDASSSQK